MLNPRLAEMVANDRINELQRRGERPPCVRPSVPAQTGVRRGVAPFSPACSARQLPASDRLVPGQRRATPRSAPDPHRLGPMTSNKRRRPAKESAALETDAVGDAAGAEPEPAARRVVSDARTMRALAHPVRLALLEAIGREGELTATRAAEMLDESPGNMSWHLQTLARYGYIEEAGGGKGRARPWRIASVSNRFQTTGEDPEASAAGEALESVASDRAFSRLRAWFARRAAYPSEWRDAAFTADSIGYLTAEEMSALGDEIADLFGRYRDRVLDKQLRPADAEPVKLVAFGHPIPPTPTGN